MRVAVNNNDFVTSEQIEKARNVDLIYYLKRSEPNNLMPSAPDEYRLKDHDSLKISNGKFHWFSRGIGGTNAVDYLVKVRGMEFKDAVRELAGESFTINYSTDKRVPPIKPKSQDDGRFFMLPEANNHNNDVIEYLKGRGVEEKIILDCIEKGLIFQNTSNNCIFMGYDNHQNPKFACERGIKSDFKKDVAGSNKAFNFCMPPSDNDTNRLYVFEGVTDCLSHASIAQIGNTDWDGYRLSLGGVSTLALYTFLENNPQITSVYLALDNDNAGKEATERIIKEVLGSDTYNSINLYVTPPPVGKDFNDTLIFMREKIREKELPLNAADIMDEQKTAINKRRTDVSL